MWPNLLLGGSSRRPSDPGRPPPRSRPDGPPGGAESQEERAALRAQQDQLAAWLRQLQVEIDVLAEQYPPSQGAYHRG